MKFRFKFWSGLALFIVLLIGCEAFIQTAPANGATTKPFPPPIIQPSPGHPGQSTNPSSFSNIPGASAIPVHTDLGVTTNNASTPAFNENDVITFLHTHGFYAGPLAKNAQLKILLFEFITAKQASKLTNGRSIGRPDDYFVCYVQVQGPFVPVNLRIPPGAKKPQTVKFGYMIFDAHTGNNLGWGTWG